jgi:hypothetical protein
MLCPLAFPLSFPPVFFCALCGYAFDFLGVLIETFSAISAAKGFERI